MEPKLILPTLIALGVGFYLLTNNQNLKIPDAALAALGSGASDMNGVPIGRVTNGTPVLRDDGDPMKLGDLVEGVDMAQITAPPAEIQLITTTPDCAIARPVVGQRVAAVMAAPGDVMSGIYSYEATEFARSAAYAVQRAMAQGHEDLSKLKRLDVGPMTDLSMSVVNVIVPPGPEPVYLVLKDQFGGILWNILPMPGATVAQVTLLAPRNTGVVNLPDGATLQAPDLAGGACGDFHRVIENPAVTEAAGFVPSDQTRAEWVVYAAWYADTFGIPAEQGLNGRKKATSVLAGAAPAPGAAKAPFAGIAGKIVHAFPAGVLYASDKTQHETWFTAKAAAEITRAFGVPDGSDVIALLRPANHERIN